MTPQDEFEKQQVKDIGVFFAQQRYLANMTQKEAAEAAELAVSGVNILERKPRDFKFSTLQKLARIFGYRLELRLVPISGEGETLVARPNPELRSTRAYGGNTFTLVRPRKAAARKPRPVKPINPGPQVQYDSDDEFDTEKELAAMRERLGIQKR